MSLRDELEACRDRKGRLTPARVLAAARDPESPLHPRFEWDDEVAGERFRMQQARELIISVKVSFVAADGSKKHVRRFHAIRASDESNYSYDDVEDVLADTTKRAILMRDMEREWRTMEARFATFDEFWRLVRASERKARKRAS